MLQRRSSYLVSVTAAAILGANSVFAAAVVAGFNSSSLPANDDGSTGLLSIGFTANFFGNNYTQLYANNNGNVTFDSALSTFTPFNLLSTNRVIIAPFFADVDTRGVGSDLLRYGTGTFDGKTAFGVTWDGVGVGYFAERVDKLNQFQLLLVSRSDVAAGDFDIYFNYDQIQWETGEASGGINGLGGNSARAGFSNGVSTAFELPGSAIDGAFLDSNLNTGLIHNSLNSNLDGRYIFQVRNGEIVTPPPSGVPDNGSTLALMGLVLTILAGARRRLC